MPTQVSSVEIMRHNRPCADLLTEAKDYHIVVSKQPLLQTRRTQVGLRSPEYFITARKRSLRRLCFHRCLSVQGGGACVPGMYAPQAHTHDPPGMHAHPPKHTPLPCRILRDALNERAVRIPLECILVIRMNFFFIV